MDDPAVNTNFAGDGRTHVDSNVSLDIMAVANPSFHLGIWLGKHHALGFVGSQCSLADAVALKEVRDRMLYRAFKLTWDDFCTRYCGISHKTGNEIIARLDEFGELYFRLSEFIRIPVKQYRALLPAIQNDGLKLDDEVIPITRENTAKLIDAIRQLRAQLRQSKQQTERLHAAAPFSRFEARLDRCLDEITRKVRRGVDQPGRQQLIAMLDAVAGRIQDLRRSAGTPDAAPNQE